MQRFIPDSADIEDPAAEPITVESASGIETWVDLSDATIEVVKTSHPTGFPDSPRELAGALSDWAQALGREYVVTSLDTIDRFSRSTLPRSTRPAAVIRPGNALEVQEVVRIAGQYGVPIYPISRGKNWGYGDACAVTDGQTIVDLSRMNAIREVNAELAYAVVEPGVTQGQLSTYLREHEPSLWLDVSGAGPDASLVGNTLERGFGHTPYGDHFGHACGLEVVLPTSELIHTGFGAFAKAKASRVFPWGVGPWLDGLFTQSNFGIVTALGLSLMRAPEQCLAFAFSVSDESRLGEVVEILRELRLDDVVRSSVHIANDLRVISGNRQYPWEATGDITPLPEDLRRALRKEAGVGAWNVMGALYGPKPCVAAAQKLVRRAFAPFARVMFFDEQRLKMAQTILKWLNRIGVARHLAAKAEAVRSPYDMLRGIPSARHLRGAAWRSRVPVGPNGANPGDCGLIWVSPVLPMTRAACDEVLPIIADVLKQYNFEPLITVTAISPRALCCVASICYDRSDVTECSQASACYEQLFQSLAGRGYFPYRAGTHAMKMLAQLNPSTAGTFLKIKQALDPQHILSPGRYEF